MFKLRKINHGYYLDKYLNRDGTCCDVCIPMPGCVNGACRKEVINGQDEEIAHTCECERFAFEHALTNETYKYTGRFCDQRK